MKSPAGQPRVSGQIWGDLKPNGSNLKMLRTLELQVANLGAK